MSKLILVRGLPGSGKSTIATAFNISHYEADMFFINNAGEYIYDASKIASAHSWCQQMVRQDVDYGTDCVVSNTFTTLKELDPYFQIAKENGIVPSVILAQGDFKNVHGVPDEVLAKMKARFVYDISPLYTKYF